MKKNTLSMVTALFAMGTFASGCVVSDEDKLGEDKPGAEQQQVTNANSYVINIQTEVAGQDQVVVSSSDGTPDRQCFGGCTFAYLAGSTLTLRVPFPRDNINCIMFNGWFGACGGQWNPCTVVLNSDLSTEVNWVIIRGCSPQ